MAEEIEEGDHYKPEFEGYMGNVGLMAYLFRSISSFSAFFSMLALSNDVRGHIYALFS